MKHLLIFCFLIFSTAQTQAQSLPAYKAETLLSHVSNTDTVYIINFWATWCGPCVKELPQFNELQKKYADRPVKVLLVSMDFKEAYPQKILSFIKKKKLLPEVAWLDETNANDFIPKIEGNWQGSIPATLILYRKNSYRNFFEGEITAAQISLIIDKQLAF